MKKFLLIIGIAFLIFGLYPFVKYISDFQILSSYGKGFVIGKVLILVLGCSLIYLSIRLKTKESA